jgi:hypothetical protein
MGIYDRDYMRRSEERDRSTTSSEDRLEEVFVGFLRKHPRLLLHSAVVVILLTGAALLLIKLLG